ncbi:MAG: hypothetical protein NE330_19300 [Lentisphaeraceae bacterium]|nr:hypothetical protein [Lentisphaeraceae bacterium]
MNTPINKRLKWGILLFTLLSIIGVQAAEKMQVYTTSTIPVKEREKALKSDSSLQGTEVTVFGKFSEFASSLKSSKPKYLIVPSAFVEYNKDYKAVYQFAKGGQTHFKFIVLSAKDEWKKDNQAKGSVGIVDELGRKQTSSFIKAQVGKFKRVKRVTKTDDLMPLLVLENANYIIIRPENYEILKAKFTAKTNQVGESQSIGHPVICVLNGTSDAEIEKLGKMSPAAIKGLGFDELRKVK